MNLVGMHFIIDRGGYCSVGEILEEVKDGYYFVKYETDSQRKVPTYVELIDIDSFTSGFDGDEGETYRALLFSNKEEAQRMLDFMGAGPSREMPNKGEKVVALRGAKKDIEES